MPKFTIGVPNYLNNLFNFILLEVCKVFKVTAPNCVSVNLVLIARRMRQFDDITKQSIWPHIKNLLIS